MGKNFGGVLCPKFWNLERIFGTSLATGKAARLLSQRLLVNSKPASPNASGGSGPNDAANSPTAYLSRSHSNPIKDLAAGAINNLFSYLQSSCEDFNNWLEARQASLAAPTPIPSNTGGLPFALEILPEPDLQGNSAHLWGSPRVAPLSDLHKPSSALFRCPNISYLLPCTP